MASLLPRLLRGAGWIVAARIAFNLLGFVSTLILARILVPADFGLVALAVSVNGVLSSLFTISASAALVRLDEVTRAHLDTAFTFGLARALLIATALCAAAVPFAAFYDDPRLAPLLFAIAGGMILPGLLNPALVQLQRDLQFRPEFVLQVSEKVAAVAAAVLIALVTESYWALVIGTIVGRVAKLIASYVIRPYVPRLSFSEARTIWGFSSWLSGSSVLTTLNLRIDQFIIGGVEGQSTLGQYVVGDDLAALPVREATTPLGLILYPAFSTMKSDHGELRRTYLRAMTTIYAVGLPIGLGFALVAEPVVLLLLGEKWAGAIIVIQVLSAFFGIRTLIMPADSIALTLGATRTLFNRTFVNFLIRMPLAIGGLLLAGIPGLLAGRFLTGIIMTAITADMVRRLIGLGFRKQLGSSIRSTVSGMTMSCVLVAWQWQVGWSVGDTARMWLELIAAAAVGAMLYVGTHLSLWLLAGRPPGAEQEIFSLVGKALRSKLGRGSAAG